MLYEEILAMAKELATHKFVGLDLDDRKGVKYIGLQINDKYFDEETKEYDDFIDFVENACAYEIDDDYQCVYIFNGFIVSRVYY